MNSSTFCDFCAVRKQCFKVVDLEVKSTSNLVVNCIDMIKAFQDDWFVDEELAGIAICRTCWQRLKNAHNFRQQVRKARKLLAQRASKNSRASSGIEHGKDGVRKERLIFPKPVSPSRKEPSTDFPQEGISTIAAVSAKRRTYKCCDCKETFNAFRKLQSHIKGAHQKDYDEYYNICDYCCCLLPANIGLQQHVEAQHRSISKYLCIKCPNKLYKNKGFLLAHIQKVHNNSALIYYCTLCGTQEPIEFPSRRELQEHSNEFHHIDDYVMVEEFLEELLPDCDDECAMVEDFLEEYQPDYWDSAVFGLPDMLPFETRRPPTGLAFSGVDNRTKSVGFDCPKCKAACLTLNALLLHLSEKHALPLLICNHCNEAFQKLADLNQHKEVAHQSTTDPCATEPNALKKCHICGKVLKTKLALSYHVNTHNRDTLQSDDSQAIKASPHQCPYCVKSFRLDFNLKQHLRTMHSKVKRHICQLCDRQFATLDHLRKHVLSQHQNERKHNCTMCSKSFTQLCHLKKHQATHVAKLQTSSS